MAVERERERERERQRLKKMRTRDGRRAKVDMDKPVPGNLVVDFSVVFPQDELSEEAKAKIRQAFP